MIIFTAHMQGVDRHKKHRSIVTGRHVNVSYLFLLPFDVSHSIIINTPEHPEDMCRVLLWDNVVVESRPVCERVKATHSRTSLKSWKFRFRDSRDGDILVSVSELMTKPVFFYSSLFL